VSIAELQGLGPDWIRYHRKPIDKGRAALTREHHWNGGPLIAGEVSGTEVQVVRNPAKSGTDLVGHVTQANEDDIETAISLPRRKGFSVLVCHARRRNVRLACVESRIYEREHPRLFALAPAKAGKSLSDAVAEIPKRWILPHNYANEGVRYETR